MKRFSTQRQFASLERNYYIYLFMPSRCAYKQSMLTKRTKHKQMREKRKKRKRLQNLKLRQKGMEKETARRDASRN